MKVFMARVKKNILHFAGFRMTRPLRYLLFADSTEARTTMTTWKPLIISELPLRILFSPVSAVTLLCEFRENFRSGAREKASMFWTEQKRLLNGRPLFPMTKT